MKLIEIIPSEYAETLIIRLIFRWGQTPLTEAILFKHTKVASLIKRHIRVKQMQSGKAVNGVAAKLGGGGGSGGGDVLWRKMVERSFMTEKEKPVYKVRLVW